MMNRQLARRLVAVSVAALALASCGSSSGAAKATTTTARPTTTATPSSTTALTLTTKAAGTKYLALVAGPNCAIGKVKAKANELQSAGPATEAQWPKIKGELLPLLRQISDEDVHFYEGLVAQRWPDAVTADVQTLVGQLTTEAAQYRAISESPTYADFQTMTLPTAPNTAGVIRAKLGLTSNVTDQAHTCP
jgi:hypothetical protein